jgi:hypothetical protein
MTSIMLVSAVYLTVNSVFAMSKRYTESGVYRVYHAVITETAKVSEISDFDFKLVPLLTGEDFINCSCHGSFKSCTVWEQLRAQSLTNITHDI